MIFVQVYLIAAFIFGDPQALDIHRIVGASSSASSSSCS